MTASNSRTPFVPRSMASYGDRRGDARPGLPRAAVYRVFERIDAGVEVFGEVRGQPAPGELGAERRGVLREGARGGEPRLPAHANIGITVLTNLS